MRTALQTPVTSAADTRPYEIFLPLTANEIHSLGVKRGPKAQERAKREIAEFVRALPGFVQFHGGDEWISDPTLGALAMFATPTFAGAAMLDIECKYGAIVGNHHKCNDATIEERFEAATIAFRHTPSAVHFARLEAAMIDYQNAHS